ncbi:hypothetical protein CAOG_04202 [Capsaspora owczarzaki ATCC 30864]|uniref:hypothetical protein n=1 Tax=Capsaspora owczarzaki (strain ATCC 30864) TaxID=595528 RepID=UPI0001FE4080|nr:hypothetical protein CAOG_04202 [Capsaspora owczarzaki ATCC 30864]|eukprot:XP_004348027.1 hypothetical protein CAOG_04202 [Capsaspora owczarzaki ATCC 30864]
MSSDRPPPPGAAGRGGRDDEFSLDALFHHILVQAFPALIISPPPFGALETPPQSGIDPANTAGTAANAANASAAPSSPDQQIALPQWSDTGVLPPFASLFALLGRPFHSDDWGAFPPLPDPHSLGAESSRIRLFSSSCTVTSTSQINPDGSAIATRTLRDDNGNETVFTTERKIDGTIITSRTVRSVYLPSETGAVASLPFASNSDGFSSTSQKLPSSTTAEPAAPSEGLLSKVWKYVTWR